MKSYVDDDGRRWESYDKYYASTERGQQTRRNATKARRTRITERMQAIKLASGCVDCGYNTHAEALEFDHRPDTEKKFAIGHAVRYSAAAVEEELAKCDIVCANCHRIRTHTRREG